MDVYFSAACAHRERQSQSYGPNASYREGNIVGHLPVLSEALAIKFLGECGIRSRDLLLVGDWSFWAGILSGQKC